MLREKIYVPYEVRYILDKFHANGYKAYIVGGYIRDSLLTHRTPNDCDICTSATPVETMELFKELRIELTGLQHGTVTLIGRNDNYEVTTFRKEKDYSDSRHPSKVEFIDDLKEDLARRDFTINAIAYNEEEGLIDYFGGIEDLKHGVIRCVGNPYDRFKEDALRILRAFRFSAQLGFYLDADLKYCGLIDSVINGLKNVAMERIREEFNKIILSDNSNNTLTKMVDYSVFEAIFGDTLFGDMMFFLQNNPYHNKTLLSHTLTALEIAPPILDVRLALLFHDIGKLKTQVKDEQGISHYYGHAKVSQVMSLCYLHMLKYDNATVDMVSKLIEYHDVNFENDEVVLIKQLKRLLNKHGIDFVEKLITVRKCDILAQNPKYYYDRLEKIYEVERIFHDILVAGECFQIKNLAINGNDLINELGMKQGKEIGEVLNRLLDNVIDGTLDNDREELLKVAKCLARRV